MAALAAATVAVLLVSSSEAIEEGGPLLAETTRQSFGSPQDPGTAFTFAHLLISNTGTEPAVLEELIPIEADREIEILGFLAAQQKPDQLLRATFPTFPPKPADDPQDPYELPALRPLAGYVVEPVGTASVPAQLFVGLRSLEPHGLARIDSFRLRYAVDDVLYELDLPYAVGICTPLSSWEEGNDCLVSLPRDSGR